MVDLDAGNDRRHRVYVLRLKDGSFYVGSTSKSIRQRAEQHRLGIKAGRACRRIGVERIEHGRCLNKSFATRAKAQRVERDLAERLRAQGHRVHQA